MSNKRKRVSPKTRKRARELRRELTPIEAILWQRLRSRRLVGLKFRRQHPIGPFITDFYCAERKLVIEIDGDTHAEKARYDASRTAWLEEQGIKVIRFNNRHVLDNLTGVLEIIKDEILNDAINPHPDPLPSKERVKRNLFYALPKPL